MTWLRTLVTEYVVCCICIRRLMSVQVGVRVLYVV